MNVYMENRSIVPDTPQYTGPIQVVTQDRTPVFDQLILDIACQVVDDAVLRSTSMDRLAVLGVMPPSWVHGYERMLQPPLIQPEPETKGVNDAEEELPGPEQADAVAGCAGD